VSGPLRHPGWLPGPIDKDDPPALKDALTALSKAANRKPTEADAPVSTFPMTPAARAAKAMSRGRLRT
jgi:hypothetical protein